MEQNSKKLSQAQIFSKLRAFCVSWKLDEARRILLRAAGQEESSRHPDYDLIRRTSKNKFLPKMADVVEAFSDLQNYYAKDDPEDSESLRQIANLNKILPYMTDSEKIVCYQNLGVLHENYHPSDHRVQAEICRNIISLAPRGKSDSTLYGAMLKIKFLRLPVDEKFEMISRARRKSSGSEIFDKEYRRALGELSHDYFWHLFNAGSSKELSLTDREKNLRQAYNLIPETDYNKTGKCKLRLRALEKLSIVYQQQLNLLAPSEKAEDQKQKLIVRQKLDKVRGGIRSQFYLLALHDKAAKGFSVAYDKYR